LFRRQGAWPQDQAKGKPAKGTAKRYISRHHLHFGTVGDCRSLFKGTIKFTPKKQKAPDHVRGY
jgi:hypothetical protein